MKQSHSLLTLLSLRQNCSNSCIVCKKDAASEIRRGAGDSIATAVEQLDYYMHAQPLL